MLSWIMIFWICFLSVFCLERPESACAVSLRTLSMVAKCPENKNEYEVASRQKNCSQYNNADCLPLLYHCVLNENPTRLVEVCAVSRYIFSGRCTSFISEIESISDNYRRNCTYSHPACPQHYNSTDSYMYSDCLNVEEGHVENKSTGPRYNTVPTWFIASMCLGFIPVLVSAFIVYINCLKKRITTNIDAKQDEASESMVIIE